MQNNVSCECENYLEGINGISNSNNWLLNTIDNMIPANKSISIQVLYSIWEDIKCEKNYLSIIYRDDFFAFQSKFDLYNVWSLWVMSKYDRIHYSQIGSLIIFTRNNLSISKNCRPKELLHFSTCCVSCYYKTKFVRYFFSKVAFFDQLKKYYWFVARKLFIVWLSNEIKVCLIYLFSSETEEN